MFVSPQARPSNESIAAEFGALVDREAARLWRRIPRSARIEFDDLTSAGHIGLFESAQRFDWSRAEEFPRYAAFRIRGAMLDELRALDRAPRRARQVARDAESARTDLRRELDRDPTRSEIARRIGRSTGEFEAVEAICASVEHAIPDTLVAHPAAHAEPAGLAADADAAHRAVEQLPERLAAILRWHYVDGVSFTDIATRLGVTKGRVSQLKTEALASLRANLAPELELDTAA